jgi:Zn-dependent protease with chaperone function
MIAESSRRFPIAGSLVVVTCLLAGSASAQSTPTRIKPGFNLFSVEQDQEIGRQSAAEAERQLPILDDRSTNQYIDAVGRRLAAVAPGAKYQYQFKVVNASDINAFALPGGYMYINRGLIEAARSEGELAGVMAHEMGHVALRHGTNQASKAYLGQTGLSLLGGFVDRPSSEKTIAAVGGFGLNALFLRFSRADEKQADIVGAQILAKAGYDPMDMVTFFQALEATEDRDPGKVAQFFSSHPPLSDRAARVQAEVARLKVQETDPVGGFSQVRAELRQMSPAPTMQEIAQGVVGTPGTSTASGAWGTGRNDGSVAELNIERPSSGLVEFEQRGGFFRMQVPQNWRAHESGQGLGVTLAPDGGYLQTANGGTDLVYGVIVNHYDPFDGGSAQGMFQGSSAFRARSGAEASFVDAGGPIENRTSLARATDDLTRQLLRINPGMRLVQDSGRNGRSEGEPVISQVFSGRSPVTQQDERTTLVTRELPDDHIVYAVFVVPARDYDAVKDTFNRMMSSLRVNTAAHD